jgi:pimeloyl-ACP methyl ester carboxylesterase
MDRLGYDRYGAQGGDWGSFVTTSIGQQDPEHVAGIHVQLPLVRLVGSMMTDLTPEEQSSLESTAYYGRWGSGYSTQQASRPQTLGYGLVDSPAAQCAWIVEKFWDWTDCDGHPEHALSRDELLDNVMFYWLPGTGASSARLYWESFHETNTEPVTVPSGCSIFPKEIFRPSRRWVETRFTDLRYFNEVDRGGHFAAFEQPDIFVDEVRAFFRLLER